MTIIVLPESAYLASHELVNGGQMGVTRKASIEWDDGTIRKCYIKVYPNLHRIRKICNEFTGFTMAKVLGIFQPESAAIIPLSKIFYSDYIEAIDLEDNRPVWAWVTTECGASIKGSFQLNNFEQLFETDRQGTIEKLIKAYTLICGQKNLSDLIAFDDLIANDDRNIGNLVMVGDGKMGVIDHGEILGRIDWISNPEILDKDQYFNNILLNILNNQVGIQDQTKFTTKSKAVESTNKHASAFISVEIILITWWKNFLEVSDIPEEEHQKYIDLLQNFLHHRTHQSSALFANRIGLVA